MQAVAWRASDRVRGYKHCAKWLEIHTVPTPIYNPQQKNILTKAEEGVALYWRYPLAVMAG